MYGIVLGIVGSKKIEKIVILLIYYNVNLNYKECFNMIIFDFKK